MKGKFNSGKRILSIFLTLLMIVTAVPLTVLPASAWSAGNMTLVKKNGTWNGYTDTYSASVYYGGDFVNFVLDGVDASGNVTVNKGDDFTVTLNCGKYTTTSTHTNWNSIGWHYGDGKSYLLCSYDERATVPWRAYYNGTNVCITDFKATGSTFGGSGAGTSTNTYGYDLRAGSGNGGSKTNATGVFKFTTSTFPQLNTAGVYKVKICPTIVFARWEDLPGIGTGDDWLSKFGWGQYDWAVNNDPNSAASRCIEITVNVVEEETAESIDGLKNAIETYENMMKASATNGEFYNLSTSAFEVYNNARRYYDAVTYGNYSGRMAATYAQNLTNITNLVKVSPNKTYIDHLDGTTYKTTGSKGGGEDIPHEYTNNLIFFGTDYSYAEDNNNEFSKDGLYAKFSKSNVVIGYTGDSGDEPTVPFHTFFFDSTGNNRKFNGMSFSNTTWGDIYDGFKVAKVNGKTEVGTQSSKYQSNSTTGEWLFTKTGNYNNNYGTYTLEGTATKNSGITSSGKYEAHEASSYIKFNHTGSLKVGTDTSKENFVISGNTKKYSQNFNVAYRLYVGSSTNYADIGSGNVYYAVYMKTYKDHYQDYQKILPALLYDFEDGKDVVSFSEAKTYIVPQINTAAGKNLSTSSFKASGSMTTEVNDWANAVNEGANALATALDYIQGTTLPKVTGEYKNLKTAIDAAKEKTAEGEKCYTYNSWKNLEDALKAAQDHMAALSPTGTNNQYTGASYSATVKGLADAITNAINNLTVSDENATCHYWTNENTIQLLTCLSDGIKEYTCSNCNTTKQVVTTATGSHTWQNAKWIYYNGSSKEQHWNYCTACKQYIYENCNYQIVENSAVAANCTTAGHENNTQCTVCGHEKTGATIPASHTLTTNATTGITTCSVCHKIFLDAEAKQEIVDNTDKTIKKVIADSSTSSVAFDGTGFVSVSTDETTITKDTKEASGAYSKITIADNGTASYTVEYKSMTFSDVDTYYVVKQDGDKFVRETVVIAPPSRLMFEETFGSTAGETGITFTDGKADGTATLDGKEYGTWQDVTNEQSKGSHSGNSTKMVSVSELNNPSKYQGASWPTMKFSFSGTGFELIGATGNDCGLMLITVKKGDDTVKTILLDTYYGRSFTQLYVTPNGKVVTKADGNTKLYFANSNSAQDKIFGEKYTTDETNNDGDAIEWMVNNTTSNTMYQVPVTTVDLKDYGDYSVEIQPRFVPGFGHYKTDDAGKKYYNVYIDGVRVINPADNANDTKPATFDSTKYVAVKNIVTGSDNIGTVTNSNIAAMFDGKEIANSDRVKEVLATSSNSNIYLSKGQSVTFTKSGSYTGYKVGYRAVTGSKVELSIGETTNTLSKVNISDKDSSSASESYIELNNIGNVVVIENTGDSVVALTNIVATPAVTPDPAANAPARAKAMAAPANDAMVTVSEDTLDVAKALLEIMNADLSVNDTQITADKDGKITITAATSTDVESLVITDKNGNSVDLSAVSGEEDNGTLKWTAVINVKVDGDYSFVIKAQHSTGYTSPDGASVSVTVKLEKDEPIDTPDEPNDEANNSFFNIILKIIEFIKMIISKIFG